MKKVLSVLFALVLLCSTAAPAIALGDPWVPPANAAQAYGYWYVIEQTEDGPAFSYLRYLPNESDVDTETIYIPKSLGGVTLTPDNLNGSVFYPWYWYDCLFTLDDDNESFALIDDVLYSKDGKTLICYPPYWVDRSSILRFPDSVCGFADGQIWEFWTEGCCLVFPDSVVDIPEGAFPYCDFAVAAKPGSAAHRFAEAHCIQFIPLGEEHTHVYFRDRTIERDETTQEPVNRVTRLICPCGDVLETRTAPYENPEESCTCMCHQLKSGGFGFSSDDSPKEIAQKLLYCVRRMIWQLLGIRQYCACGARHW